MPQLRGVQPSSTAGPNAHNRIGSRTTAVCQALRVRQIAGGSLFSVCLFD